GTEKEYVALDYRKRVAEGISACQKVINLAYGNLARKTEARMVRHEFCDGLHISSCDVSEKYRKFAITAYNPTGRVVTYNLRVPVKGLGYKVFDPFGKPMDVDIFPLTDPIISLPGRIGSAKHEMEIKMKLPALGWAT